MIEVNVDPDTGQVQPVGAVLIADVGTVINFPAILAATQKL